MIADRAVVLARGLGTRMRRADAEALLTADQRRAADAGMKSMMPIGGRPFLDFVLSAIADAGVRRVALVVPPDYRELRERYESESPPRRVTIDFVVQPEPAGTADAVLWTEPWTGGTPFLVVNADNLYPADVLRALAALDEPGLPAFDADDLVRTSNIEPDRVRAFALIETDSSGYLRRIVEKPGPAEFARPGGSVRVSMNCWRFDHGIFGPCRDVPRSPRGEFELPVAVGLAVARGMRLKVIEGRGPVLDLSRRADAAEVARRLAGIAPQP